MLRLTNGLVTLQQIWDTIHTILGTRTLVIAGWAMEGIARIIKRSKRDARQLPHIGCLSSKALTFCMEY